MQFMQQKNGCGWFASNGLLLAASVMKGMTAIVCLDTAGKNGTILVITTAPR